MYDIEGTNSENRSFDQIHATKWLDELRDSYEFVTPKFDQVPHLVIIASQGTMAGTFTMVNTITMPGPNTYGTFPPKNFIDPWGNTIRKENNFRFLKSLDQASNEREAITIARLAGLSNVTKRLEQLLSYQEKLEPEEEPLSLASLKQFIGFLLRHCGIREPAIVLTDSGNISAIWERSEKQIFSIEFDPSGDVRYLAFVPNDGRSDGVERTASWSTKKDVFHRAEELGAKSWMVL